MNTIELHNVCPNVFSGRDLSAGDVWQKELRFERGEMVLLEAASGTGKTSLCSFLYGWRTDYSGDICFDERALRTFSTREVVELRRTSLSQLFQDLRLFPELTARENVDIKNALTRHKSAAEIDALFERLGIAEKQGERVGRMSFGQQQRVALIRALCQPFDFLLADEPISHLDDENGRIIGEILTEEIQARGAGAIITSIGKHIPLPYAHTYRL